MATISHNDRAPSGEAVTYSLGSAEPFTLTGSETHEVEVPAEDDRDERVEYDSLVANAETHPWLKVDRSDEAPADSGEQVVAVDYPKTAIDAGLDQSKVQYATDDDVELPIAETLAADDEQGDEPVVIEPDTPDEPDAPADDEV